MCCAHRDASKRALWYPYPSNAASLRICDGLSLLPDSPADQLVNAALLALTGFFIGGPSNMISSAISADLGRQDTLRSSQEALATVTGIVDGTGSIGAAGGQVTITQRAANQFRERRR